VPISVPQQQKRVNRHGSAQSDGDVAASMDEAEERLLRTMGWSSSSLADDFGCEESGGLTAEEIAEFQSMKSQTKTDLRPPAWMGAHGSATETKPGQPDSSSDDDSTDDDM
jgi:hypothetical protein